MSHVAIKFIRHTEAEHMYYPDIHAGRSNHARVTEYGFNLALERGDAWRASGYVPDIVEASPVPRAQHTAAAVLYAAGLEMDITMRGELNEKCHGALEGQPRTAESRALF